MSVESRNIVVEKVSVVDVDGILARLVRVIERFPVESVFGKLPIPVF
jgi:hypothetical protein